MPETVPGRVQWNPEPANPRMVIDVEWPAARLPAVGEVVTCAATYRGAVAVRIERVGWEVDPFRRDSRHSALYVVHGVEVDPRAQG